MGLRLTPPGRRVRGALIGAGSIAPHHMAAWQAIEDAEIVAIADPVRSRAAGLADKYGIGPDHIYDGHEALLTAEQVDFVDVATGPALHREQVTAAADLGVHVLCQKPFTESLGDAEYLISYCAERGVRCVVNENWRWRPWYRDIRRLLDDGAIGEPRYAAFTCHRDLVLPRPDGTPPDLLLRQPYTADMPRLILFEWGIHLIDVLRFLLGQVASVEATTRTASPLVKGEDVAVAELRFRSGAAAVLDISWASMIRPERKLIRGNVDPFVLEGAAGTIELDPYADDALHVTTSAGTTSRRARGPLTPGEAYQLSFESCQRNFIRMLLSGERSENEAEDNLQTLAVTLACYESAATGRRVSLP